MPRLYDGRVPWSAHMFPSSTLNACVAACLHVLRLGCRMLPSPQLSPLLRAVRRNARPPGSSLGNLSVCPMCRRHVRCVPWAHTYAWAPRLMSVTDGPGITSTATRRDGTLACLSATPALLQVTCSYTPQLSCSAFRRRRSCFRRQGPCGDGSLAYARPALGV